MMKAWIWCSNPFPGIFTPEATGPSRGGFGGGEGSDESPPTHGPYFPNACMQCRMRDDAETRRCLIANIEYEVHCTSEYKGQK